MSDLNRRVEAAADLTYGGKQLTRMHAMTLLDVLDRFDAAHGVVRVRLDDALTEKIARVIWGVATTHGTAVAMQTRREAIHGRYFETAREVVAVLREGSEA